MTSKTFQFQPSYHSCITVTLTRHAHTNGIAGILLLPPFYYKPINDVGLETYIERLLEKIGENKIQIYLYHYPQLTGVPFTISLIERLVSKYPDNIIGMKDSGGDWSHMEQVLNAIPGFRLYSGNEKFLLPVLKTGGVGCISMILHHLNPNHASLKTAA